MAAADTKEDVALNGTFTAKSDGLYADNTLNQSGSCGINKVLDIEMPFTLTKVG